MEVGAERTEGEERGAYVDVEPRCFFEDAIQAARFCDGAGERMPGTAQGAALACPHY